jgi:hypothetical protein
MADNVPDENAGFDHLNALPFLIGAPFLSFPYLIERDHYRKMRYLADSYYRPPGILFSRSTSEFDFVACNIQATRLIANL